MKTLSKGGENTMLDTLGVSVPICLEYEVIKDWDFKYTEPFWKAKKYRLKNGASIFFKYNTFTHILHFQFSASKIQHGTNARPYDFSNSVVVESEIEKAIENILGGIYIETCFLNICRIDLNRDFVFGNEKDANAFMDFAKKILPARCETRKNYETGFTSQTNAGNGFRLYRKDLDKHLKKKVREKMPPTVRIEFQMNRKFASKFYRKRFNLHEILTNEFAAKMVWNKQLRKYGLDKKIVNRKTLDTVAKKHLTETQQQVLIQMNDEPEFEDRKLRKKKLQIIHKMKGIGICPYSCQIDIDLSVSTIKEIINFRKTREFKKWETTLQQKTKSQTQLIRRITKFIDDSS